MKMRFFMCVLTLISATSFAQTVTGGNGGQYAENNFAKFNYVTYQNGKYVVSHTNKQVCNTQFEFNWLGKDSVITIPANTTKVIELPGTAVANTKIRSRPLDRCSGDCDMGWLEIWSPITLPMQFKSFSAKAVNKHS